MVKYPVASTSYCLQAKGSHHGKPMFFIRFSDYQASSLMTASELVGLAGRHKHVVLGGSEPLRFDLQPLVREMNYSGKLVHLETTGHIPLSTKLRGNLFWVSVFPSMNFIHTSYADSTDDVVFYVGLPRWQDMMALYHKWFTRRTNLWVMPYTPQHLDEAIAFCLENPEFRLCCDVKEVMADAAGNC